MSMRILSMFGFVFFTHSASAATSIGDATLAQIGNTVSGTVTIECRKGPVNPPIPASAAYQHRTGSSITTEVIFKGCSFLVQRVASNQIWVSSDGTQGTSHSLSVKLLETSIQRSKAKEMELLQALNAFASASSTTPLKLKVNFLLPATTTGLSVHDLANGITVPGSSLNIWGQSGYLYELALSRD